MDMKVSDAITALVEFALPRFSPEDKFLHIPIDARATIYDDDGESETYRDIHFLFQRPHNYTKVFIAIDGWKYAVIPGEKYRRREWKWLTKDRVHGIKGLNDLNWHMTSDHDSCWRSDGVDSPLFQIGMHMRDTVLEISPGKTFRDINWHVWLSPLGGRIGYVNADVVVDEEANEGRNDTYMKKPVNIREIPSE